MNDSSSRRRCIIALAIFTFVSLSISFLVVLEQINGISSPSKDGQWLVKMTAEENNSLLKEKYTQNMLLEESEGALILPTYTQLFGSGDPNSNLAPLSYRTADIHIPPPEAEWLLHSTAMPTTSSPFDANENPLSGIGVTIPKKVYKLFLQKKSGFPTIEEMPQELRDAHHSWILHNPGYTIHYFDLALSRLYLAKYFHPSFLRAFDCIEAFAGKADLFRLAVIYREGGWYSDWKQVCLVDSLLDKISKKKTGVFFRSKWGEAKGQKNSLQNALFGATPRHPVLARAINIVLSNIQSEHYGKFPTQNTSSGPLGEAYYKYMKEHKDDASCELAGFYDQTNQFYVDDQAVVLHKCKGCPQGRDTWSNGNDYVALHRERHYYCQTAASIFVM